MYRRQRELDDGRTVFHGREPGTPAESALHSRPRAAMLQKALKKKSRAGQLRWILIIVNFIVLLVMFGVSQSIDRNSVNNAGVSWKLNAVNFESEVLISLKVALEKPDSLQAGKFFEAVFWQGPPQVIEDITKVVVPADAVVHKDTIPAAMDDLRTLRIKFKQGAVQKENTVYVKISTGSSNFMLKSVVKAE